MSGENLEQFLYKNFIIFIHDGPLKSTGQTPQQFLILNLAVLWLAPGTDDLQRFIPN